jgi:hypothetical protein
MSNLSVVLNKSRRSGITTWILKSAIKNPNVIILSSTLKQSKLLRDLFDRMIDNSFWLRLKYKYFRAKKPQFESIDSIFLLYGVDKPVILDNSVYTEIKWNY